MTIGLDFPFEKLFKKLIYLIFIRIFAIFYNN
jgi:hypothetical protein